MLINGAFEASVSMFLATVSPSPSIDENDGIIVLRSSNIQDGKLEFTDIVRVKKDISEKLMVEKGDIIICARNGSQRLVGKSALVDNIFEPMTFGAFMCICKSQFNTYIHKYLQTSLFFEQLVFSSNTKEIYQLTQNRFNKFLIPTFKTKISAFVLFSNFKAQYL